MKKTVVLAATATALMAILAPSNARAQVSPFAALTLTVPTYGSEKPGVRLGLLDLHPFYRLSEAYDSNIYLVPRGQGIQSSWITSNELGLDFYRTFDRKQTLYGSYDAAEQLYTAQPSTNDNLRQRGELRYGYSGPHGLSGEAGDAYLNTTDPASSELTQREKRWNNDLSGQLKYAPRNGPFGVGIDASDTVDKYLDPTFAELLNRYEIRGGATASYKIEPKTTVFAAYHRGVMHYPIHDLGDPDKDNKADYLDAGVEGQLAPKITGKLRGGYAYRQYNSSPGPGISRLRRDWTVDSELDYEPIRPTSIRLTLRRDLQESIFGANLFYVENLGSLDLTQRLSAKLSAVVSLAMSVNEYPLAQTVGSQTAVRRDDIYQEGATLRYDFREWLSTQLSYLHRQRDSIFTGEFNYEDHLTELSLTVRL